MAKYNKLLSKFAVLLATLGAGATLASAHVSAHADSWEDGVVYTGSVDAPGISAEDKARVQKMINTPDSEANKRADAKVQASLAKLNAKYDKQQDAYEAKMEKLAKKNHVKDYGNGTNEPTTATTTSTTSDKKTTTKKVAKKTTVKKATKKHVKKATVKKVAKKHAKTLFRIRVKAQKIYAYKNIKLQKQGRKAEKKGTKLYVYGIVKKGHKTFYKVYGGRVITASKSAVTKINNYVSRVIV
ncbi:hypothetical protein RZ77_00180 [Apilactobacillus kunkeei]|uniref:hypothetical protein n=1 Tax=Apilactobacillus kunkeei TaxID=148814 RepID=UPI0006CE7D83|nr:hypothetical protein [Apilactobacillus kunkeei]KPN84098.1 hypothetical protein RZ77_00180 [Apilactobacillus kunkeei]